MGKHDRTAVARSDLTPDTFDLACILKVSLTDTVDLSRLRGSTTAPASARLSTEPFLAGLLGFTSSSRPASLAAPFLSHSHAANRRCRPLHNPRELDIEPYNDISIDLSCLAPGLVSRLRYKS